MRQSPCTGPRVKFRGSPPFSSSRLVYQRNLPDDIGKALCEIRDKDALDQIRNLEAWQILGAAELWRRC